MKVYLEIEGHFYEVNNSVTKINISLMVVNNDIVLT
jgi:hypothetical protein